MEFTIHEPVQGIVDAEPQRRGHVAQESPMLLVSVPVTAITYPPYPPSVQAAWDAVQAASNPPSSSATMSPTRRSSFVQYSDDTTAFTTFPPYTPTTTADSPYMWQHMPFAQDGHFLSPLSPPTTAHDAPIMVTPARQSNASLPRTSSSTLYGSGSGEASMSLDAPLPQDDELWDRIDMGTGPSNGVGNRPDSSNGGHSPRSRAGNQAPSVGDTWTDTADGSVWVWDGRRWIEEWQWLDSQNEYGNGEQLGEVGRVPSGQSTVPAPTSESATSASYSENSQPQIPTSTPPGYSNQSYQTSFGGNHTHTSYPGSGYHTAWNMYPMPGGAAPGYPHAVPGQSPGYSHQSNSNPPQYSPTGAGTSAYTPNQYGGVPQSSSFQQ
ncbi:hypothetical protein BU26DRAFT_560446 [Trematosphaeria pertusa]|uniref:Uncharacterized protein n=1 Tax=Trematosphaeria pertusa TaxID=390896 RepID=A0A6A6ISM5_9PLEO|nr:uncharacterized protein BU26DRAFT_560446 [Trematosphaeria pertusa]KAF2253108.1 hypothetical protein BU26DRAFT_560446 [Trematosphaeria pertusa]